MMDSALLHRMQSGMKVVVSFNRPHDSIGVNEKRMESGVQLVLWQRHWKGIQDFL
jgi:hypothetical protein